MAFVVSQKTAVYLETHDTLVEVFPLNEKFFAAKQKLFCGLWPFKNVVFDHVFVNFSPLFARFFQVPY